LEQECRCSKGQNTDVLYSISFPFLGKECRCSLFHQREVMYHEVTSSAKQRGLSEREALALLFPFTERTEKIKRTKSLFKELQSKR
jgi:hypothetical protein